MFTDRILSLTQAAEMMGISENAIYAKTRTGKIFPIPGTRPMQLWLSEVIRVMDRTPLRVVPSGIEVDPNSNTSRLLTYHETATFMGLSLSALSNRMTHGRRPVPIRCADGCAEKWMYRLSDIIDAMDNPNALTPEEREGGRIRQAEKTAAAKTVYDIQYETIRAQCPTCGHRFNAKVVKGSSKWLYCKGHVSTRNYKERTTDTGYNLNYL